MYKKCEEILKELENEKKIKVWWTFKFPEKEELKLRLKDLLETNVDEKYYLSDKMIKYIMSSGTKGYKKNPEINPEIAKTLLSTMTKMHRAGIDNYVTDKCIQIGKLDIKGHDCIKRVYSDKGISPTLTDMQGGNRQPKILIKNATKKGYIEAVDGDSINLAYPNSKTRRGRVGKQVSQTLMGNDNMGVVELPCIAASRGRNPENPSDRTPGIETEQRLEINNKGTSNCITTVQKDNYVLEPKINIIGNYMPSGHNASRIVNSNGIAPTVKENHGTVTATNENFRIRKLTPKECWRLMGFSDEDFEKAEKVPTSNTQLYKQAGNSICVPVLEKIFKNLLIGG